jgi:hypothetical protein
MYGLNEIVAMNACVDLSHEDRVSSECLSFFNRAIINSAKILSVGHCDPITHGEWEAEQQKEREHESASNE